MKQQYCQLCMEDITKNISLPHFIKQDQMLCETCLSQIKELRLETRWNNTLLTILYEYNDFLENMIFQYKEGHDVALQDVFFHDVIQEINRKFRHYTIVIMPSSTEKLEERGFVPVKQMLSQCKLPVIEPFYKSEDYKQSLQSFHNRAHINQVIHMKHSFVLPSTKLLLVDDVCTSGSTINCAYQLLSKHTHRIEAMVLSATHLFVESCDEKGLKRQLQLNILKHVRRLGR